MTDTATATFRPQGSSKTESVRSIADVRFEVWKVTRDTAPILLSEDGTVTQRGKEVGFLDGELAGWEA